MLFLGFLYTAFCVSNLRIRLNTDFWVIFSFFDSFAVVVGEPSVFIAVRVSLSVF